MLVCWPVVQVSLGSPNLVADIFTLELPELFGKLWASVSVHYL